jgi:hypothetical protein
MKRSRVVLCTAGVLGMMAACDRPPDLAPSALQPLRVPVADATHDMSMVWEGDYSPDGQKIGILVTWGGTSRVATVEDGEAEPATLAGYDVHSFAWLPGSDHILTAHEELSEGPYSSDDLVVWDAEGGFIEEIGVSRPLVARDGLAVSPDGRLAVAAATRVPGTAAYDPHADLVLIDLDLGFVRNLTLTPDRHEHSPEFVAPGRIVFARRGGGGGGAVISLDITTGRERRLSPRVHSVVDVTAIPDGVLYSTDLERPLDEDTTCYWRLHPPFRAPTPLFCIPSASPDLAPDGGSVLLNVDPPGRFEVLLGLGDGGRIVEVDL